MILDIWNTPAKLCHSWSVTMYCQFMTKDRTLHTVTQRCCVPTRVVVKPLTRFSIIPGFVAYCVFKPKVPAKKLAETIWQPLPTPSYSSSACFHVPCHCIRASFISEILYFLMFPNNWYAPSAVSRKQLPERLSRFQVSFPPSDHHPSISLFLHRSPSITPFGT